MYNQLRKVGIASTGALLLASAACASLNKKEQGAIIGATGGAVVGGVVGKATGSTARGAIIGAAVGGAAGAIIGHQMDQKAKEIQQTVAGAQITRVGEGLVVTFESGLLFDFDSDQLREASKTNLDVRRLEAAPRRPHRRRRRRRVQPRPFPPPRGGRRELPDLTRRAERTHRDVGKGRDRADRA